MYCDPDFPYVIETLTPPPLPVPPRAINCPHTPEGKVVWSLAPNDRLEVLRTAQHAQAHAEVYCILLTCPSSDVITAVDLRAWADEATQKYNKPILLASKKGPCPCGETCYCQSHLPTQHLELAEHFEQLKHRSESFDAAIDYAFSQLSLRDRRILHRWATQEDPVKRGTPIRHGVLATENKLSTRQISRIIDLAKAANPAIFKQMEHARTFRYRKTGAYEVR
jgi:hypothetical protein